MLLNRCAGLGALSVLEGPGRPVFDLVELLDPGAQERLRSTPSGPPGPLTVG